MEWIKQTDLKEVKEKYGTHHGFAFLYSGIVSDKQMEEIARNLISDSVTKSWPLLATRFDGGFLMVFEDMNAPRFWSKADFFNQMGFAQVIPLIFFLNTVE